MESRGVLELDILAHMDFFFYIFNKNEEKKFIHIITIILKV